MKTINVPTREQVNPQSQIIFDAIAKKLGKVPNLYATIGYSAEALKAMLDFEETLNHGIFTAKEREAVYLVVSQVNGCDYCLAAHTVIAGMRGFTKDEILNSRRGQVADPKLNAVLQLAKAIAENKGNVNSAVKDAFFEAGFNEAALIELAALVALRTFTNYVYALTAIPVDFPAVEKI
ncbi:carboxymuconolactone decarboxylase family protein [Chitinophaga sp. S165]|uniref:carboxymuconolactone decarboxylase family protein n=1 Tax=Chitinophaga sp. S165 TaxID=2135462 RepID=UPI000D70DC12|nr:carboxymuconolactone decarboxylase family protein [Chitinophaga sp. S165]PWV48770.1 putative peroxidase-related enzyme [Chitinophaga sp. S165]